MSRDSVEGAPLGFGNYGSGTAQQFGRVGAGRFVLAGSVQGWSTAAGFVTGTTPRHDAGLWMPAEVRIIGRLGVWPWWGQAAKHCATQSFAGAFSLPYQPAPLPLDPSVMKFGMNLLLWSDGLNDSMWPILEKLKAMGFDGVELPIFELNPEKYAAYGKRLDDLGLERTAVTVRTDADNPISADAKIRAEGVAKNRLTLDCCQAAGVQTLVGPFHSALGSFSGAGPTKEEWAHGVDSMRQTAEYAQKAGVMLGVEYLNRFEVYFLNSAADTVRFVQEVNHPYCRMMYDTFHANIEEKNPATAIRTCAPYTVHVHISENDRSTPGQGNIPWQSTFDALREVDYNGWLVVEAFGLALPALAAATRIWRRMFESELKLAEDAIKFMKGEVAKRWK